jgi:hypothetical protein
MVWIFIQVRFPSLLDNLCSQIDVGILSEDQCCKRVDFSAPFEELSGQFQIVPLSCQVMQLDQGELDFFMT